MYTSSMKCTRCQTTHCEEAHPIVPVILGIDLNTYIQGFPYITEMNGDNQVHCDTCSRRTPHVKKEKLNKIESSTIIFAFDRRDNHYQDLNITEFLQLGHHTINTHELVGATLHFQNHFRSLRKVNNDMYWCNDNRINRLPSGYTPYKDYTSTHATMVVYDKIRNIE